MDNALLMRLLERLGDFRPNLQNLVQRQRAFLQTLGQSLTLEILHYQEVGAVLRPDVIKGADVGMLERGNRPGFPLHALL